MGHTFRDKQGTRYQLVWESEGPYEWLFLPGGPGADSCYLQPLIDALHLPGKAWLIDFPTTWWFDWLDEYDAQPKWIPHSVPTLILGGQCDYVCPITLFQKDDRFQRDNISIHAIEDAGHFPWIEKSDEVVDLIHTFVLENLVN